AHLAIDLIAELDAGGDQLVLFGSVEDHLVPGVTSKRLAAIGKPTLPRNGIVIIVAGVPYCVLAAIGDFDRGCFALLKWSGKDQAKVRVLLFLLLDEVESFTVFALHPAHAQSRKQLQWNDGQAIFKGAQMDCRLTAQKAAFLNGGIQ